MKRNTPPRISVRRAALAAPLAALLAARLLAAADTVAWWHFDEEVAGASASGIGIVDSVGGATATAYSCTAATPSADGDYIPVYGRPFPGLAVYDPVSDTTRTNRSAMKFTTAPGGSNPDKAYYGGVLKVPGTQSLLDSCKSTVTIEAFVCTTGGLDCANNFAPIFASIDGESWTGERWALYLDTETKGLGGLAFRVNTGKGVVRYQESATSVKINDGLWHHVAYVFDGTASSPAVKLYIDYALAKEVNNDSNIKTSIPYGSDNAIHIGGYDEYYNSSGKGYRRFPGLIDEVRISSGALAPAQFLRLRPLGSDVVAHLSFDPGDFGSAPKNDGNLADFRDPDAQTALFKTVSGATDSTFDTATKAGSAVAAGMLADAGWTNAASFCQTTNGTGAANYIQLPSASAKMRNTGADDTSYTIELFYKTRGTVRGSTDQRQTLFQLGGGGLAKLLFNAGSTSTLLYSFSQDGEIKTTQSNVANADDGNWHHVAFVADGPTKTVRYYFDYALDYSREGSTMPDISTGNSLFVGCGYSNGTRQFFNGWLDDVRVTKRALAPEEFLTTHPVGSGDASLLALFERDYSFACASNAAFSVTGAGEARTGGNPPMFVQESRGALLLDGTNGTERVANEWSARLNTSRVAFPSSDLFELDAYTVEFWAKFDAITNASGEVAADSSALEQHAPILRFVRNDTSAVEWYLFRHKGNARALQMSLGGGNYPQWTDFPHLVVDGKWHHWALTFSPNEEDATKTDVELFLDHASRGVNTSAVRLHRRVGGHRLVLGEGTYDQPNLVGEIDALRFSRGVLDPSQFLGRAPVAFTLVVR